MVNFAINHLHVNPEDVPEHYRTDATHPPTAAAQFGPASGAGGYQGGNAAAGG